jgi:hypothetical protein
MMSSGAAYSSDPHRVSRYGEPRSTKRDKPKSVSLTKGEGIEGREVGSGKAVGLAGRVEKGREVRRMSDR